MPLKAPAKPTKETVAFFWRDTNGKILLVKRPPSDKSFPNLWSLPSGSVEPDETPEMAVIRSAHERLGVEVKIVRFVGDDQAERDEHNLHMNEYEVKLVSGQPVVPQPDPRVKQYTDFMMSSDHELLKLAATKGSLCSRIFLQTNKAQVQ